MHIETFFLQVHRFHQTAKQVSGTKTVKKSLSVLVDFGLNCVFFCLFGFFSVCVCGVATVHRKYDSHVTELPQHGTRWKVVAWKLRPD